MRTRRRWLEAAVVSVAMALVLARILWHAADARRVPCPRGYAEDAAREARVVAVLGGTAEGRAALRDASGRRGRMCFGVVEVPVVTAQRTLLLRRDASDAETAARVAHLLTHLAGHFPPVDGFDARAPCGPQVDAALRAEGRALSLESSLRARLGVRAPMLRFGFDADWHAAPPDARDDVAYRWLLAHPHGGEGTDALADAYAARCAEVARGSPR